MHDTSRHTSRHDDAIEVASGFGVGSWTWDIAEDRWEWSEEALRIHGRDGERRVGPGRDALAGLALPDRPDLAAMLDDARTGQRRAFELHRRIVRPDGAVRLVLTRARLEVGGGGAPRRLIGVDVDLGPAPGPAEGGTEAALAESEARYRALFASIDEGYCLCEIITAADGTPVDYRFLEINPLFEELTGLSNALGRTALDLVPDLEPHWVATYARAGLGRERIRFEERSDVMGRSFDVFAGPAEPHGRFVIVFRDVTERTRQAERIRLLVREVTHRTKNILAVVQAVARQTVAHNPDDYVERLSQRIAALAFSHDLLVAGDWAGVGLEDLVRSQLDHFADLVGERVSIEGPALMIRPSAAEAIGMALHELSTNAGKYGALSDGHGRVAIVWQVEGDRFRMSWTERDGPPVVPPTRRGFGSVVVERLARMSLSGDVSLDYDAGGVVWTLVCPMTEVASPLAEGRETDGK